MSARTIEQTMAIATHYQELLRQFHMAKKVYASHCFADISREVTLRTDDEELNEKIRLLIKEKLQFAYELYVVEQAASKSRISVFNPVEEFEKKGNSWYMSQYFTESSVIRKAFELAADQIDVIIDERIKQTQDALDAYAAAICQGVAIAHNQSKGTNNVLRIQVRRNQHSSTNDLKHYFVR